MLLWTLRRAFPDTCDLCCHLTLKSASSLGHSSLFLLHLLLLPQVVDRLCSVVVVTKNIYDLFSCTVARIAICFYHQICFQDVSVDFRVHYFCCLCHNSQICMFCYGNRWLCCLCLVQLSTPPIVGARRHGQGRALGGAHATIHLVHLV